MKTWFVMYEILNGKIVSVEVVDGTILSVQELIWIQVMDRDKYGRILNSKYLLSVIIRLNGNDYIFIIFTISLIIRKSIKNIKPVIQILQSSVRLTYIRIVVTIWVLRRVLSVFKLRVVLRRVSAHTLGEISNTLYSVVVRNTLRYRYI
jgi:hypothetical protein